MYPMLSLAYIVAAIEAYSFLNENITVLRWARIILIEDYDQPRCIVFIGFNFPFFFLFSHLKEAWFWPFSVIFPTLFNLFRWLTLGSDSICFIKGSKLMQVISKSGKQHLDMNSLNCGYKHMSCFEYSLHNRKRSLTECSYPADLQVSHFIPATQWMASCCSLRKHWNAWKGYS